MELPFYSTQQNLPENIELLKASAVAYNRAKRNEYAFTTLFFILAFAYPLMYTYKDASWVKYSLFSLSLASTLIYQILLNYLKGNTSIGALLKEQFDTKIFGLPWKFMLTPIDDGEIINLSGAYKRGEIKDWYPINISPKFMKNTVIAICQRTNCSWDKELRIKFFNFLLFGLSLYTVALIIFLFLAAPGSEKTFLICFSLASVYTHFITLLRGDWSAIKKRKLIIKKLDSLIDKPTAISTDILRDIQDEIYNVRQEGVKVPDIFFRIYNKKFQININKYIEKKNADNPLGK